MIPRMMSAWRSGPARAILDLSTVTGVERLAPILTGCFGLCGNLRERRILGENVGDLGLACFLFLVSSVENLYVVLVVGKNDCYVIRPATGGLGWGYR